MKYQVKRMKWTMVHSRYFTANQEEYKLSVYPSLGRWTYHIDKDNATIDSGYSYPPCTSELDAKVKAEKALQKILNKASV